MVSKKSDLDSQDYLYQLVLLINEKIAGDLFIDSQDVSINVGTNNKLMIVWARRPSKIQSHRLKHFISQSRKQLKKLFEDEGISEEIDDLLDEED